MYLLWHTLITTDLFETLYTLFKTVLSQLCTKETIHRVHWSTLIRKKTECYLPQSNSIHYISSIAPVDLRNLHWWPVILHRHSWPARSSSSKCCAWFVCMPCRVYCRYFTSSFNQQKRLDSHSDLCFSVWRPCALMSYTLAVLYVVAGSWNFTGLSVLLISSIVFRLSWISDLSQWTRM